jgi:hypothetical protein
MKSVEIEEDKLTNEYQLEIAYWLKEIAYQLAVMNEREEDNNYFQEYGVRLRPEK